MEKPVTWTPEARTVFFLFLILVILGVKCSDELSGIKKQFTSEVEPDRTLVNTRIVITENSITTAIIESQKVKIFDDRNFTSLEDSVIIDFFNKEGEHVATLTALYGEVWGLNEKVDSLKARGDVVVVSEERNASMESDAIRWIATSRKIYGEGLVTITSENGFEQGTGFVANDDLTEYEFTGPVKGEVRGSDIEIFDEE